MQIIGLTGRAGSGKDSIADYLVTHHGFVKYSLASPLKAMLRAIGVDADQRDTKELPHPIFGASPRRMAQTLGTEWMRNTICDDGWLRLAQKFVDDVHMVAGLFSELGPCCGIVISDVRFENEAEWLRAQCGTLWHVHRPEVAAVEAHASEAGVIATAKDWHILNSGSMDALYAEVNSVFLAMRG